MNGIISKGREVLEDFNDGLTLELRKGITQSVSLKPNDPLVRTAELRLRWGVAGER